MLQALRAWENITFQQQIQDYSFDKVTVDLNMNHLKGCFAFWMIGLIIASVVFIKEVYMAKTHRKYHSKTPKIEFTL